MTTIFLSLLLAQVPVLPPQEVTAIVNGIVITAAGPTIPRGTVILRGAKIEAVGAELPVPVGARVVDATGKYVAPGFVAIEASGLAVGGIDGNFADNLDPYQLSLRVALACGITTANVIDVPFFGFFGGEVDSISGAHSAILKLTQGDLEPMLVREPGLNYLAMPTRQVELNMFRLRESFRKAAEHLKAVKEAAEKKAQAPRAAPELGSYITILENERPTVVAARTVEQVRDLLKLHAQYPFDLVLSRPTQAVALASQLVARRIPVLLKARGEDFDFDLARPVHDEQGLVPIQLPAVFAAAGAAVSILPYRRGVSLDGLAGRDLTALSMEAAFAIRGGLDEEKAIQAITIEPARILRIADRVGSLEKGKDADVLILTRHPLDFRALVERVYIHGKVYYERSKSPLFRDVTAR